MTITTTATSGINEFGTFLCQMFKNEETPMTRLEATRIGQDMWNLSFKESMQTVQAVYSNYDPTPVRK